MKYFVLKTKEFGFKTEFFIFNTKYFFALPVHRANFGWKSNNNNYINNISFKYNII